MKIEIFDDLFFELVKLWLDHGMLQALNSAETIIRVVADSLAGKTPLLKTAQHYATQQSNLDRVFYECMNIGNSLIDQINQYCEMHDG